MTFTSLNIQSHFTTKFEDRSLSVFKSDEMNSDQRNNFYVVQNL